MNLTAAGNGLRRGVIAYPVMTVNSLLNVENGLHLVSCFTPCFSKNSFVQHSAVQPVVQDGRWQ